ncbi:MAG: hypothetical protein G8D61_06970 [gamma proteobacterium symbiont of Ctena orbiculata]|nr:hypothetical protein [Candidatus Thiodiazotropha sp. (ex Lucina pensylvanica)]MBT3064720.1 hypothetical protein [Candidatus Thiodiazotropha sp. (ex Lucina pensylvanica)]PUB74884.1 MAG: hypothetical protein DBP03_09210 [gamma proteobacterium symbiont of Ctena orbiculata]PUB76829.1 MAG: hypothetical protein DBO99_12065 [gamma proteobacterium symbiont of Ctena orbiculata]
MIMIRISPHTYPIQQSQRGSALVISLILLTIITILSVSAMRSTNLDTKIAVNHQLKELSYRAAENAFAQLIANPLTAVRPETIGPENAVANPDFYQSLGVVHQPDISADITMELIEVAPPGKYKFNGHSLNRTSIKYQADSVGRVLGSNTRTTNRMELVWIRN